MQFVAGDIRTAERGGWLFDQIVATGSLVLRRLGGNRADEIAAHRYLSSPHVTVEGIVQTFSARTQQACAGRRVVVAQDTTEINFSGRSASRRGLGPAGDGKSPGFFMHPSVAVDADGEVLLGLAGLQIWTRAAEKVTARETRASEDKESIRWLDASKMTAALLAAHAAQVIGVCDREGDVWGHFAHAPQSMDLVVRSRHDRPLDGGGNLFAALEGQAPLAATLVKVAPRGPGDKGRIAKVILRAGRVRIRRPEQAPRSDPAVLELSYVEAVEVDAPAGVKPLLWRILTTLPAESADQAKEVIGFYRLRWRIEEVFRALKRDGLALEETQMQDAQRLFRLAAMGLGAAVRIIQLVDARDGGLSRPMNDVLDQNLTKEVAILVRDREGATAKQKNPHPEGSLAWLSWVVARYGGWNCYGKPPGPKTMAYGWPRFCATLCGVILAQAQVNP